MKQNKLPLIKKECLTTNGFSIIEVVVASAIFGLIVTSFVGTLIYLNQNFAFSGARPRAVFLAEEALEAVRNIRDENFDNLADGAYGLSISGSEWVLSGQLDITDIFTRQVEISSAGASAKQVTANVSWQQPPFASGSVSLITYLTNWSKEIVPTPTPTPSVTTCSNYCLTLGYASGICRQNSQQCTVNKETHEETGDQYCIDGPQVDTCCCAN